MCDQKASDQPAHTRSLIRVLASRLNILRLGEQHLEFIGLLDAYARLSLNLSKCPIVGNHMFRLSSVITGGNA